MFLHVLHGFNWIPSILSNPTKVSRSGACMEFLFLSLSLADNSVFSVPNRLVGKRLALKKIFGLIQRFLNLNGALSASEHSLPGSIKCS